MPDLMSEFTGPVLALCVTDTDELLIGSGRLVCAGRSSIQSEETIHGIVAFGTQRVAFGGRTIIVGAEPSIFCNDWVLNVCLSGEYVYAITMHNRVEVFHKGVSVGTIEGPEHALLYSADIYEYEDEIKIIGGGVLSRIFFWSLSKMKINENCLAVCHHRGSVFRVRRFGSDEVLTTSDDRTVARWNGTKVVGQYTGHSARVWDALIDGSTVVTACEDSFVRLFDKLTGTLLHTLAGHAKDVRVLAVGKDAYYSGGEDGHCLAWKKTCREQEIEWSVHNLRSVHIYRGSSVVAVSINGNISLLLEEGNAEIVREGLSESTDIVTVSALRDQYVFLGHLSGRVIVYDMSLKAEIKSAQVLTHRVVSLFPLEGGDCIAANANGQIEYVSAPVGIASGAPRKLLSHIAVSSRTHLFGDDKGSVSIWHEGNIQYKKNLQRDGKIVGLFRKGEFVLASTGNGKIFTLQFIDSNMFVVLEESVSQYLSFVSNIANDYFSVGFSGPDFIIHDNIAIQWKHTCGGHRRPFDWFVTENEYLFAYVSGGDKVTLVRAPGPSCVRVHTGHAGDLVHALLAHEDGIITACEDGKIRLVDSQLGETLSVMEAHEGSVRCLCRTGTGEFVSGGARSQLCRWKEVSSGRFRLVNSVQIGRADADVRLMGIAATKDVLCIVDSAGEVHVGDGKDLAKVSIPEIISERAMLLSVAACDSFFVAGSSNGFLLVIDSVRMIVTDCLHVHLNGVNALVGLPGGLVVSVSDDQSIAVSRVDLWGKLTLCQRLENASTCSIRAVAAQESRVVTTGTDRRVTEWRIEGERILKVKETLVAVTDPLSVIVNQDIVVGGRGIEKLV